MEAVLTAMVPEFAREESSEAERRVLLIAVGDAMEEVHARAEEALGAWKVEFAGEVGRRKEQEINRSLLRVIVRAWREEADGRRAASLRTATLPVPPGGRVGGGGRAASDWLPSAQTGAGVQQGQEGLCETQGGGKEMRR